MHRTCMIPTYSAYRIEIKLRIIFFANRSLSTLWILNHEHTRTHTDTRTRIPICFWLILSSITFMPIYRNIFVRCMGFFLVVVDVSFYCVLWLQRWRRRRQRRQWWPNITMMFSQLMAYKTMHIYGFCDAGNLVESPSFVVEVLFCV